MADKDKKKKRPRHIHLVVPGDQENKRWKKGKQSRGHDTRPHRLSLVGPTGAAAAPETGDGASPAQAAEGMAAGQPPAQNQASTPEAARGQAGNKAGAGPGTKARTAHSAQNKEEKTSFWQNFKENLTGKKAQPKNADAAKDGGAAPAAKTNQAAKANKGKRPGVPEGEDEKLPPNAVRMPQPQKRKKRMTPARRRRLRRRAGALALALLVTVGIIFFSSGAYLSVGTLVSDAWDSLRIAAQPGDGFPMDLATTGYIKTEPMGKNGFAMLSDDEVTLVTSTGTELRRVHHGYLSPGLSAGKTRVVVYNRGGKAYTVEGRSETMVRVTTEQDILFCSMSPDGWLAVVTKSRYTATLRVLGPDYDTEDPEFRMQISDEEPLMVRFASDNKHFALACISTRSGALGTSLYLLRTDRDAVQAEIRENNALLLQMSYLDGGRILAVYDKAAVLYNQNGEELARYGYGDRSLVDVDITTNRVALLFGATSEDMLHVVLVDGGLEPLFDISMVGGDAPQVLAVQDGAYLLVGQQVTALSRDGATVQTESYDAKTLGFVQGSKPLLITSGRVEPLEELMNPPDAVSRQSGISSSQPSSASAPPPSSALPASDVSGEAPDAGAEPEEDG